MMDSDYTNKKILVVGGKMNYLVTSIKDQLIEAGMEVKSCVATINELSKVDRDFRALVLYMDSDIQNDYQLMVFLKDYTIETDTPIFAIGSKDELQSLENKISSHRIQQEFERPLNVHELVTAVTEYAETSLESLKKKILVVDDSSVMLSSLKNWLSDKYHITLADSVIAAIKCLSLNKPDLILLDLEMPVVDGKTGLEMIRSEMDFADIPVIFLTGKNDQDSVRSVLSLKPSGYLLKSMKPNEIVQAIDEFFIKRKGSL